VLGHGVWKRRFGGDPGIVGRRVRLDGEPFEVVGVMPASFRFPEETPDFWIPLSFPPDIASQRGAHYLDVVARLKPGVTIQAPKWKSARSRTACAAPTRAATRTTPRARRRWTSPS
jgi:hypothetical protein